MSRVLDDLDSRPADSDEEELTQDNAIVFDFTYDRGKEQEPGIQSQEDEVMTGRLTYNPVTNKCKMDFNGKRLLMVLQVDLNMVHTGFGPDRFWNLHRVWKVFSTGGIFDEDLPEEATSAAHKYLMEKIRSNSVNWQKKGGWTMREDGSYCTRCKKSQASSGREANYVTFANWMVEQVEKQDFNGEVEPPGDALCVTHAISCFKSGNLLHKYSSSELDETLNAIDHWIKDKEQA